MKLTLDTGCFPTKDKHPELDRIFELEKQGKVIISYADAVLADILQGQKSVQSLPPKEQIPAQKRLDKTKGHQQVKSGMKFQYPYNVFPLKFHNTALFNQVKDILFPQVKTLNDNQDRDVRHVVAHIMAGNDVFITKNTNDFIKNGKREALAGIGAVVKTPDEFISQFD